MYYKRWELQQRIVAIYSEILLISGLVLLGLDSGGIVRRSTSLRHRQNERAQWKTRLGLDLHHRSNHLSKNNLI